MASRDKAHRYRQSFKFLRPLAENPEVLARRLSLTPSRRTGTPAEGAGVAVLLAAPIGAFITGQNLAVDSASLISYGNSGVGRQIPHFSRARDHSLRVIAVAELVNLTQESGSRGVTGSEGQPISLQGPL